MSIKQGILSFRWKCFRGLKDTNWIHIKPLTIFIGSNNSGKTSLFYPLLIMKQTIESMDMTLPLRTKGKYVNVGNFKNLIYDHDDNQKLTFEICFNKHLIEEEKVLKEIGEYPPGNICLIFQKGNEDAVELESFAIKDIYNRKMLERKLMPSGNYSLDFYKSDDKTDNIDIVYNKILKNKPKHFLFDGKFIIKSLIKSEIYLFSWDEIPRNDNERLIEFLNQNFDIDWVKNAIIDKINDGRAIRIFTENNYLSLILNDRKNEVNLEIDDGRTHKFIAKTEGGKLNIYWDKNQNKTDVTISEYYSRDCRKSA